MFWSLTLQYFDFLMLTRSLPRIRTVFPNHSSGSSASASVAKGPSNTASPGAMYSLTQWAKDLMESARTAQHTYNPGLMLEALMAQAQQALR